MCGIFGVGFLKGNNVKDQATAYHLVESLGKKTEGFGSQCSGIMVANPYKISYSKYHEGMAAFLRRGSTKALLKAGLLINSPIADTNTYAAVGHCRMPTKGKKENNNNNHPIRVENIVGVHAGHVGRDDALFVENIKNFTRIGEVDSEIIFQLLNYYRSIPGTSMVDSIKRAAPLLGGSFTCAVLSSLDKYKLYLFRSEYGPTLEAVFYEKLGLIVFATRYASIIEPVMKEIFKKDELDCRHIDIATGNGVAINLRKNTYSKFSLTEKEEWSAKDIQKEINAYC